MNDMNLLRVVLDTNVIVAGLQSRRGASHRLLQPEILQRLQVLLSVPLFLEYEAAPSRPEHRAAHGLSDLQLDSLLTPWAAIAEPVSLHYLWRPQLRDPQDEMVLETAVNGRADGIVTFNIQDFVRAAPRFGLALWTPADCLSRLLENPS